jgi:hypothetical protein
MGWERELKILLNDRCSPLSYVSNHIKDVVIRSARGIEKKEKDVDSNF